MLLDVHVLRVIPLQHVMLSRPSGALELQVPALFPDILSARDIDCSSVPASGRPAPAPTPQLRR